MAHPVQVPLWAFAAGGIVLLVTMAATATTVLAWFRLARRLAAVEHRMRQEFRHPTGAGR